MKPIRLLLAALFTAATLSPSVALACDIARQPGPVNIAAPTPAPRVRTVDLVIALDTSNSMDGLITSAKARLWDVVNELARAKPTPRLRVALYSYGNDSYEPKTGWVRRDSDFTTDLDGLYQKLSALRTNGGTEYVSRVGKAATDELAWDDGKDTLKILFIAGNEPANQDPTMDPAAMAKSAISKGIVVNTIYCGTASNPEAAGWAAVAKAADGRFAVIDQDRGIVQVATPMDAKLADLSGQLNKTYVSYGHEGAKKKEAQAAADNAAAGMGAGVAASRAQAKAGALYQAAEWDAVDAEKATPGAVAHAKDEDLPAEMRGLSVDKREAFVKEKAAEREKIQKAIAKLSQDREKFIAEAEKKTSKDDSLGAALKSAVHEEAQKKGYRFE